MIVAQKAAFYGASAKVRARIETVDLRGSRGCPRWDVARLPHVFGGLWQWLHALASSTGSESPLDFMAFHGISELKLAKELRLSSGKWPKRS